MALRHLDLFDEEELLAVVREFRDRKIPMTGRNAAFALYEDEGTNYDYEMGLFSYNEMRYDEREKQLTIAERREIFPDILENRTFEIIFVSTGHPVSTDARAPASQTMVYNGNEIIIKPNKLP